MSDNSNQTELKKLRNEVQLLRDELAIMKRKYEDIIYNLDTDNFSGRFVKEYDNMKTDIKVTAEGIESKVSNEEFKSTISQTAESISSIVSEFVDVSQAAEVNSSDKFTDQSKIYVIRERDTDGNVVTETFYHYNTISKDWKPISADGIIYSLFEQREDGFYLKGNVKVDGSCVLTDSLTFDSSSHPLQIEYSVDGLNNWHSTFASGQDKFMRIKTGGTWSSAMKVIGDDGRDGTNGSSADVDDDTIFALLTAGGTTQGLFPVFYDGGEQLYINAQYIKTGTLSADRIDTENLSCTRLYAKGDSAGYSVRLNGNLGDFGIFTGSAQTDDTSKATTCMFGVYNDFNCVDFYVYGQPFLRYNPNTLQAQARGTWDFSKAAILGTAKFG